MEIKILHKHGKSLRTIASEVGVSVNTVRKYLKYDGPYKYQDR
ncbi:MAG: helix-turn-helix domain-containing protein, partial [Rickettsia endosymbiont of Ecitomorpha arachnoides]|nr:helix-turn-helix domain-containing protein [Rickettsia endosymbiont of Ecitomorpha arachnoides]